MQYDRPDTLTDALWLLKTAGGRVLAGGTDVYPAAVDRPIEGPVLDISGIAELRGIRRDDGGLRIGACTTWTDIRSADLPPALDALKAAATEVGGRQIQNAGTVAGNLCNASPAADGVPPLMVLDAAVELTSSEGRRVLPLAEFIAGPRRTRLRTGEIVAAVLVPEAALTGRSGFLKLGARRHLVISIAMVAARIVIARGRVAAAALAVGACGPVASRLPAVEARLVGTAADGRLANRIAEADVAEALAPIDDMRGSAGYRLEAATELLRRAVTMVAEVPA